MDTTKKYSTGAVPYLTCIDHTVSNESYQLVYNSEYDMLVTTPVPQNLASYYESEAYISHTDRSKGLFETTYQLVKKYALKKKLSLINQQTAGPKKILDIGAGTGDFLKVCKDNGWDVTGVEPSAVAQQYAQEKGLQLHTELAEVVQQEFEVITMWHVLEHVRDLDSYIEQLKKLLSPTGTLVIAVPNFKSYDAQHYKSFWAAFDVPRHLWHFSKESIKRLFKPYGFQLQETKPMKFDAYYVSLLSEKYKTGSMRPIRAMMQGFKSNWQAKKTQEYSSLIYLLKKV